MDTFIAILILIAILMVLVLVHEWGHFFSAKKFGIRVDEFGFGFPPKIFGIKRGETEYTFNLFPVGGFVKIFGENPDEASISGPESTRSFVNKPRWQQAIVLFAGVFMNFVLAWLLFSFSFTLGLPTSVNGELSKYIVGDPHLVITSVLKDSPADKSGIRPGDKIITVRSGTDALIDINPSSFKDFISKKGNTEVEVSYIDSNNLEQSTIIIPTLKPKADVATIGVSMDQLGLVKLSPGKALIVGFQMNFMMIKGTMAGLYHLIIGGVSGKGSLDGVSGPVGLVGLVGQAYNFGFAYLLSFIALISVSLGAINLVPFPALDGGRLLFLLIEKIKGSRLNPKFANIANTLGFFILIALMILVTYHDIVVK